MKRLVAKKNNRNVGNFVGKTAYRFGKVATRVFNFANGFTYQQKQAFGRVVCHTQNVVLTYQNWFGRGYFSRLSGKGVSTS